MRLNYILLIIFFLYSSFFINANEIIINELPIVVIVPSYNNAAYYKKNLDSIFCQDYQNFSVIYIDDNSHDHTAELVQQYIKDCHQEHRFKLIKNSYNRKALANLSRFGSGRNSKDQT